MPPQLRRPTRSPLGTDAARYAGLGMTFAVTIVVFALAGWWLDGRLGTEPWLLILFVFLGFFGGLISLVNKVEPAGSQRKGEPRAMHDDSNDPRPHS